MYDLIVIGGGPAGMGTACAAHDSGLGNILIIERDIELGGILNQCVHNGFGLRYFKEELTGPEYAARFIDMVNRKGIAVMLDTMVLDIGTNEKAEILNSERAQCRASRSETVAKDGRNMPPTKYVTVVGKSTGYRKLEAKAVVLAMGCRERTRGAIGTPGTRPAGVITAGAAQRYINVDGYMPGRKAVILGSGDIGLIMARRMVLEGAEVLACIEIMKTTSGLARNVVQCLKDFDIPLLLSHTVTKVIGKDRVERVEVSKVDDNLNPIPGTEISFECDTLLLSVGLIPENELSLKAGIDVDPKSNGVVVHENMETRVDGFFACGNAVHVHDLVDKVTIEAMRAGKSAAEYVLSNYYSLWLKNKICDGCMTSTYHRHKGDIVNFPPPVPEISFADLKENELICTSCPNGCLLKIDKSNGIKVTGNGCPRGVAFGKSETLSPVRTLTTTVKLVYTETAANSGCGSKNIKTPALSSACREKRLTVKTDRPIPKELIFDAMLEINKITLDKAPQIGTVILRDILSTGANVIVTKHSQF